MDTLVPGLIGLTLFGLGGTYFARFVWLARSSRHWPVVEGTITRSSIRKWKQGSAGGRTSTYNYSPEVRYVYQVAGQNYCGSNVCFGREWNTSGGAADRTVVDYPVGKKVQVRHHPLRPDLATLETQASNRVYLALSIAMGMSCSILYGIVYGV